MKAFDQVLAGMFQCPPECNPMVQCLIKELVKPQGVEMIPPQPLADITMGWSYAREKPHPPTWQFILGTT